MDIFIKSFNRPYYLEKCLYSIEKYVQLDNKNIIVLDDGTPIEYLEKIKTKFPYIKVLKSNNYIVKSNQINKKETIKNTIPIDFWLENIKKATSYFILLEDDMWFTKPVFFEKLDIVLEKNNIQMLKLFWLNNSNLIPDKYNLETEIICIYKPKLTTLNINIYTILFCNYKYKWRKIVTFLKIYSLKKELQYYQIYSVAGVVFNKNYFLNLFKNHKNNVDEKLQIKNAIKQFKANKNFNFANFKSEVLQTSFISTASNEALNEINYIINKKWFENDFNSIENFPNDYSENYFSAKLGTFQLINNWKNWVYKFKKQYIDIGCKING